MTTMSEFQERHYLVTVGATVGFPALTSVAIEPAFWAILRKRGFTSLRLQCGPDVQWASKQVSLRSGDVPDGFKVDVFERRSNLMKEEMVLCKAAEGRRRGLIISHAGKLLSAHLWRLSCMLIHIYQELEVFWMPGKLVFLLLWFRMMPF